MSSFSFHLFHPYYNPLLPSLLRVNPPSVWSFMPLSRFHQIHIPIFGMFAGDTCRKQNLRERSRITSSHGSGVIHLQSPEYVRSREPFASLFIIFSYPEAGMKDFLCRTRMIKSGIVALQFPFLFFCEPIADAGEQFSFQLGMI